MSDLSIFSNEELESDIKRLLKKLDIKLKEAGPLLEEIGRLREQVRVVAEELENRNVK